MKFQELRKVINPNEYITVWAKTKISGNKEDFDFDKFEAFSVKKVMC